MTTIILIAVAVFVIIFVGLGFRMVRQAECMVIERLGKYNRTLDSGVNILWPLFDRPRAVKWRFPVDLADGVTRSVSRMVTTIDLRETVYDFPKQNVITKDNVVTEINALLYFQVTDPVKLAYEIANLPDAIEKLTQTTLRNIIGEMDLDETLASRDTINSKLRAILDQATDKWGIKVNRVELQDINPPQEIRDAMEKQMRAERDRRAAILEAEGLKRSQILEAEGIREAEISKAEGQKKAKILLAEGEAGAITKLAEAEAQAIRTLTEAFTAKGANPASYMIAIRYIEALKAMVTGQDNKVVYLPYEATGILSSLGGIRDLLGGMKGPS